MHMFGMAFNWLWFLLAAALILIAIPAGLALFRRVRSDSVSSGAGATQLAGDETDAQIFRLAQDHGGRLTVSDVVVSTGMTAARAEEALQRLTDGVRVRMEVKDSGRVVYEFVELIDE